MKLKQFVILFVLLLGSTAFAGRELNVGVNGMVCGFCAQGISKKFMKDPAVDTVKVSLENKIVNIKLKDGKDISDDAVTTILKDAGYSVSKIERKL